MLTAIGPSPPRLHRWKDDFISRTARECSGECGGTDEGTATATRAP